MILTPSLSQRVAPYFIILKVSLGKSLRWLFIGTEDDSLTFSQVDSLSYEVLCTVRSGDAYRIFALALTILSGQQGSLFEMRSVVRHRRYLHLPFPPTATPFPRGNYLFPPQYL